MTTNIEGHDNDGPYNYSYFGTPHFISVARHLRHQLSQASGAAAWDTIFSGVTPYLSNKHEVELLRLKERYNPSLSPSPSSLAANDEQHTEAKKRHAKEPAADVRRILFYIPRHAPRAVYEALTDVPKRRQWDKNYLSYFTFNTFNPKALLADQYPTEDHRAIFDNDFDKVSSWSSSSSSLSSSPLCSLLHLAPCSGFEPPFELRWCSHSVGNLFLSSVGIQPRRFLYEVCGARRLVMPSPSPSSSSSSKNYTVPALAVPSPEYTTLYVASYQALSPSRRFHAAEESGNSRSISSSKSSSSDRNGGTSDESLSSSTSADSTSRAHQQQELLRWAAAQRLMRPVWSTIFGDTSGSSSSSGSSRDDDDLPHGDKEVPVKLYFQEALMLPVLSVNTSNPSSSGNNNDNVIVSTNKSSIVNWCREKPAVVFAAAAGNGSTVDDNTTVEPPLFEFYPVTTDAAAAATAISSSSVALQQQQEKRQQHTLNASEVHLDGTIISMTTSNDWRPPRGLPTWAENSILGRSSDGTGFMLLSGLDAMDT